MGELGRTVDHSTIIRWLRETDTGRLARLWRSADAVRAEHVGDAVHLRALVEISNHCVRQCHYCGLRAGHDRLPRFRMTAEEIQQCVVRAKQLGLGTVVLQTGEDPGLTRATVASLIRRIKSETGMAVTLSLGERTPDELAEWRRAGADRYLLRFETSDQALFARLHPWMPGHPLNRLSTLRLLRDLGYEVGSGVMIGLPRQSLTSLANDLLLFRELELDMIGVGPFIAHPETPLGFGPGGDAKGCTGQVPADELTTCKVVALARLLCPDANIPATTALSALNPAHGIESALGCGANVVMPNFSPQPYRLLYSVYPGKSAGPGEVEAHLRCLRRRIESIGRSIGSGRGDSPHFVSRASRALRIGG